MASRTLSVALRATVQGYTAPMAQAAGATSTLEGSLMRVQRAGAGVAKVGDTLTTRVSLPLVAIGAVAVKMAADFDKSFTTMQTLAGVTADEVDGLKESVLDLAGQTGRAPQELAEALYFLQSSGLDSAQAMDALEVSAKASAAGLGDTKVIADAVSSAMLGYAESGLTAAEATDVLVATAREGKAEPAELAQQMGRLIPVASELGISFDQVGGAIAALSTKGFNAEQATTALTNVMAKLLKPSQQAAEQLESVGLSADSIRQMIAEKGLLGTLEELRSRLGESGFVKFLEDQQAVQGGLALLGGDLNKTKEIMAAVADSAGATDNAFSTWAESMGAKNAKAFADFQVALIRLGDVLAPIAANVAEALGNMAEAFGNLPDGAQTAIVYLGLFLAALGPILSIGGRVATMAGSLYGALLNLAVPAGTVSGAFDGAAVSTSRFATSLGLLSKVGLVVGGLIALRQVLGTISDDVDRADLSKLENQLLDLADTGEASGATLRRVFEGVGSSLGDSEQMRADLAQLDDALAKLTTRDPEAAAKAFRLIKEELEGMGVPVDLINDRFDTYNAALAEADTTNRTTASAVDEATRQIEDQAGATDDATSALQKYADALRAQFDPLFAVVSASQSLADANADVTAKELELAAAIRDHGADSLEAMAATDALTRAQNDAAKAAFDQETAMAGLVDMVRQQPGAVDQAKAKLQEWVNQGWITQASADATAAKFDEVTGSANQIPAAKNTVLTANDQASGPISSLEWKLRQLDGRTATVNIITRQTTILAGSRNVPLSSGGIVPAYAQTGMIARGTDTVPAMLTPGEMVLNRGQQENLFRLLSSAPVSLGGGGQAVVVNVNIDRPVIASEREFERMVTSAANRGLASGEINVRGRRIA